MPQHDSKSSVRSFPENTQLTEAQAQLAAAAAAIHVACSLPGPFPVNGTGSQQAFWLHDLLSASRRFADDCIRAVEAKGLPADSIPALFVQVASIQSCMTMGPFLSSRTQRSWQRATVEAADLLNTIAAHAPLALDASTLA